MGRKRPEKDQWIPSKVYRGKSAFEYRPIKGVCIRLCSIDSTRQVVIKRYAIEYEKFHTAQGTVKEMARLYFESDKFQALAPNTQKDYFKHWKPLEKVFGKVKVDAVKPEHVREYMDIQGKKSKTQANRQHSLFSAIYSWGFERGKTTVHPCKGVSKFTEGSRERYIEDAEYMAVYEVADNLIRAAMEIAYLCAARKSDIIKMTKSQIRKEGIYIKQGKTGKAQIKAWSARLRQAIKTAEHIPTKNASIYVLPKEDGTAFTTSGFDTRWQKALNAARDKSNLKLKDFHFHDLKAKGISDYEGDKQKFSGHKTLSQVAIYDRKTQVVEALNVPTISNTKKDK